MEELNAHADFLERTAGATMRQVGICIAVVFVILAVNLNYRLNWSGAYQHKERAAINLLNQLYPEAKDGEPERLPVYEGKVLSGTFNERNTAYLACVDGDFEKLAQELAAAPNSRQADLLAQQKNLTSRRANWTEGFRHLAKEFFPTYDMNSPEQRKTVRAILEEDLKQHGDDIHQANTFQLPLLGISFDSEIRSIVLGAALFVTLGGLVFALRREVWITEWLLAKCADQGGEQAHELSFRQIIYLPPMRVPGLRPLSRSLRINTLRAVIWTPLLLQVLMLYGLWQDRWLADTNSLGYKSMVAGSIALAAAIGFLAVWTQSLLTRLWLAWERCVSGP